MVDVAASDGIVLTIAAARDHLRVRPAELSDAALTPLIATAEALVGDFLARPLVGAGGWNAAGDVPANVVHAVKIVLTDLYENRERPLEDIGFLRNLIGRYVVVSIG